MLQQCAVDVIDPAGRINSDGGAVEMMLWRALSARTICDALDAVAARRSAAKRKDDENKPSSKTTSSANSQKPAFSAAGKPSKS